jgi:adenine deaminase
MQTAEFIKASRGDHPCDLLLANARIVDVFSGEIIAGNVAVSSGRIAGIGEYPARRTVDLAGRFLAPGFIDSHVHIESSMACVGEFARAVVVRGTTAVVADPHEIANVLGGDGIRYMLDSANDQPVNVFYTLPSCVPATDMETAGGRLAAADLEPFFENPCTGTPQAFPEGISQRMSPPASPATTNAQRRPRRWKNSRPACTS